MNNYSIKSRAGKMLIKLAQLQDGSAMTDAPIVETKDNEQTYRFKLNEIAGEIVIHVHNDNELEANDLHNDEVLEWLDYLLENVTLTNDIDD